MANLLDSFRNLVNGNQSQAGTNNQERLKIWGQFVEEFPSMVCLEIEGMQIVLTANTSVSGKSTSYFGNVTADQYLSLTGSEFGLSSTKVPFISVQAGVIEVNGGGKYYSKISNERVSDLLPF